MKNIEGEIRFNGRRLSPCSLCVCDDCCCGCCSFVALRPKSTAMVMAGRSVQLTSLFSGQA